MVKNLFQIERWSRVIKNSEGIDINLFTDQTIFKNILKTIFRGNYRNFFLNINRKIYGDLRKGDEVIIESSKEMTRALLLLIGDNNLRIINLIRNPIDILESNFKRIAKDKLFRIQRKNFKINNPLSRILVIVINSLLWNFSIIVASMYKMFYNEKIVTKKYEDLVYDTEVIIMKTKP